MRLKLENFGFGMLWVTGNGSNAESVRAGVEDGVVGWEQGFEQLAFVNPL